MFEKLMLLIPQHSLRRQKWDALQKGIPFAFPLMGRLGAGAATAPLRITRGSSYP